MERYIDIDGIEERAQKTFRNDTDTIVVYRALPGVIDIVLYDKDTNKYVNDFRNLDSFEAQEKVFNACGFTIDKENEMTVEKFNALLDLI